jgi:hypothetical protein
LKVRPFSDLIYIVRAWHIADVEFGEWKTSTNKPRTSLGFWWVLPGRCFSACHLNREKKECVDRELYATGSHPPQILYYFEVSLSF